jgi:hypothetical protein
MKFKVFSFLFLLTLPLGAKAESALGDILSLKEQLVTELKSVQSVYRHEMQTHQSKNADLASSVKSTGGRKVLAVNPESKRFAKIERDLRKQAQDLINFYSGAMALRIVQGLGGNEFSRGDINRIEILLRGFTDEVQFKEKFENPVYDWFLEIKNKPSVDCNLLMLSLSRPQP